MTRMLLLGMDDGGDYSPVRVVPSLSQARDALLAHGNLYGDREEDEIAQFHENWDEQLEDTQDEEWQQTTMPGTWGVQFESGFGSYDYRIDVVEVG